MLTQKYHLSWQAYGPEFLRQLRLEAELLGLPLALGIRRRSQGLVYLIRSAHGHRASGESLHQILWIGRSKGISHSELGSYLESPLSQAAGVRITGVDAELKAESKGAWALLRQV